MQFINIVVHSVEDMNFRVHLQYDFTKLNLEEHLEVISNSTVLFLVISGFPGVELVFYRLNGSKQLPRGADRSHRCSLNSTGIDVDQRKRFKMKGSHPRGCRSSVTYKTDGHQSNGSFSQSGTY